MNTTDVVRELASDGRELTPDETEQISGGMTAMMIWGSNVVAVSSGGLVLVSTNGGKSGSYSRF
jgi:hypothetical protein